MGNGNLFRASVLLWLALCSLEKVCVATIQLHGNTQESLEELDSCELEWNGVAKTPLSLKSNATAAAIAAVAYGCTMVFRIASISIANRRVNDKKNKSHYYKNTANLCENQLIERLFLSVYNTHFILLDWRLVMLCSLAKSFHTL